MLRMNIWRMDMEMLMLWMLGIFDRCNVSGECGNEGMLGVNVGILGVNVLIDEILGVKFLIGAMLGVNVEIGEC